MKVKERRRKKFDRVGGVVENRTTARNIQGNASITQTRLGRTIWNGDIRRGIKWHFAPTPLINAIIPLHAWMLDERSPGSDVGMTPHS